MSNQCCWRSQKTPLLDSETYPTLEIVSLYNSRWDVEVNLKHLKSTLGMEVLRGKTPEYAMYVCKSA